MVNSTMYKWDKSCIMHKLVFVIWSINLTIKLNEIWYDMIYWSNDEKDTCVWY